MFIKNINNNTSTTAARTMPAAMAPLSKLLCLSLLIIGVQPAYSLTDAEIEQRFEKYEQQIQIKSKWFRDCSGPNR